MQPQATRFLSKLSSAPQRWHFGIVLEVLNFRRWDEMIERHFYGTASTILIFLVGVAVIRLKFESESRIKVL